MKMDFLLDNWILSGGGRRHLIDTLKRIGKASEMLDVSLSNIRIACYEGQDREIMRFRVYRSDGGDTEFVGIRENGLTFGSKAERFLKEIRTIGYVFLVRETGGKGDDNYESEHLIEMEGARYQLYFLSGHAFITFLQQIHFQDRDFLELIHAALANDYDVDSESYRARLSSFAPALSARLVIQNDSGSLFRTSRTRKKNIVKLVVRQVGGIKKIFAVHSGLYVDSLSVQNIPLIIDHLRSGSSGIRCVKWEVSHRKCMVWLDLETVDHSRDDDSWIIGLRLVSSDTGAYGCGADITIRRHDADIDYTAFAGDPIHYKHHRLSRIERISGDIRGAWRKGRDFIKRLLLLKRVILLPAPGTGDEVSERKKNVIDMIGWCFEKASDATEGKDSPERLLGKLRSRKVHESLAEDVDISGEVTGYDLALAVLAAPGNDLIRYSELTENRQDGFRRLCCRAVEAIFAGYLM